MSELLDELSHSMASAGPKLPEGNAEWTSPLFKQLFLFWPNVHKLNLLKDLHQQCTSAPLLSRRQHCL